MEKIDGMVNGIPHLTQEDLDGITRNERMLRLADKWLEETDIETLKDFFYDYHYDYLKDQTDEDFNIMYEENFPNESN